MLLQDWKGSDGWEMGADCSMIRKMKRRWTAGYAIL
jgi:hypothetical protein